MEMEKKVRISRRLQCICEMVTPGVIVADVGCDHGFVPIYLVQNGICPFVLAMDVKKGPLSMAEMHVRETGLEKYIELRLSEGLNNYRYKEAQCMICAGMGGKLMQKILTDAGKKVRGFQEMILQPQSDIYEFRRFLREQGLQITDERIICEDGKYYFPMKVVWKRKQANVGKDSDTCGANDIKEDLTKELGDRFGALLLKRRDPVLYDYLAKRLTSREKIAESLAAENGEKAKKAQKKISTEMEYLKKAMEMFGGVNVYIND